jgi:CHAD domain-containing protein
VEALERVTAACEDRAERRAVKSAARRLQQAPARDRESGPVMRDVAEQLPAAKSRVLSWPPLGDEFETIGSGLARTYADGQAGFRSALRAPSPETFHEWRKRVKDHWYHTQILRQIGEDLMTAYREQMETLSDLLGQRHDLDVVRQVVRDAPSRFGSDNDLRLLWNAIDRHSDHLTGSALKIGAVAYSEPTEVVAQRFEAWWRTWCEETAPAGHAVAAG